MDNKIRVQVLLNPETIKALELEAKEKSISLSAVIRQKVVGYNPSIYIDAEKLYFKLDRSNKLKRGE